MKKWWRRMLVLLIIFIGAASAFAFYRYSRREQPTGSGRDFRLWTGPSLPLVYGQVGDYPVNMLHGYTGDIDAAKLEDRLMLVQRDGSLPLTVLCYEYSLDRILWEVRDRSCSEVIASGEATEWMENHDTASFTLQLGSVAADLNREYRLNLTLVTKDGPEVKYYTRLRRMDALHAEEMVEYVMSFHSATFDKGAAAQYAINMESDGTADDNTLEESTLHSSYQQLTWGDLAPVQVGNASCQILEIDASFGSFLVEYEMEAEDSNGETDRFLVTEYVSLQWSDQRWKESKSFFMMDYHREVEELLSWNDTRLRDRGLELGIQPSRNMEVTAAEGGGAVFTAAGELWSYQPESRSLARLFTFRHGDNDPRHFARKYRIQVLEATADEVTFLVYGYMESGAHEGQVGISCLQADLSESRLREAFFLPCSFSLEDLGKGVETLCCKGGTDEVYLMAGDAVYSINFETGEAATLVDRVSERHLVVNEAETAIAWQMEIREGETGSVQIFYLETGESQIVGAGKDDWVSPCGFIEEDCVLGLGHIGESVQAGAVQVDPFYAVEIRDRSGGVAARYELDDVRITSVSVAGGQVLMERVRLEGEDSSRIEDDTLIRNQNPNLTGPKWLVSENDRTKKRVWLLSVKVSSGTGEIVRTDLESVAFSAGGGFKLTPAGDASLRYYGWVRGRNSIITDTAGEAIAAVYDGMGAVTDSAGRLVWHRTGRQNTRNLRVAEKSVELSESRRECMKQLLASQGLNVAALEVLDENQSAMEWMEALFPGRAVNLSGAPMRALLLYVDEGRPVLLMDSSHKYMLLAGYDPYNIILYDPVLGYRYKMGQNDATEWLEKNAISAISFLAE